jgi:germination protein M
MKKNNLYIKNIVYSGKKVFLSILSCVVLVGMLFVFSCTPLDDSMQTSGDAVNGNSSGKETEEENAEVVEEEPVETAEDNTEEVDSEAENDGKDEEQPEESETGDIHINVYYADSMAEYLVGEARTVSSEHKYTEALYELMKLPVDSSIQRLIPETTKINSVTVEDGLAKVDISKEFVEDRFQSDTVDILLIYSVVNTLTEFSEINSVSFYIDGEKLDILGELAIDEPIFRRSDLIKQ